MFLPGLSERADYGGAVEYRGVWLFQLSENGIGPRLENPVGIIPLSGEWVLGSFSSSESRQKESYDEHAARWHVDAIAEIEKAWKTC